VDIELKEFGFGEKWRKKMEWKKWESWGTCEARLPKISIYMLHGS